MRIQTLAMIGATILLSGCSSTYSANRYSISAENVLMLENLSSSKIKIGQFTASEPNQTSLYCRSSFPVMVPDGQSFEQYIQNAFQNDLSMAHRYSDKAPITLTGHINSIDFTTGAKGQWMIDFTLSSSNGKSINLSENYNFTSSFDAIIMCQQTAQALMPAVQNLIGKAINHPKFKTLLK